VWAAAAAAAPLPAAGLFYSAVGTMAVFAGMIIALLYKGVLPITHIAEKPAFFGGVFAAMTGFGAVMQLLLSRRKKAASPQHASTNQKSD
jgi:hypothetical protein